MYDTLSMIAASDGIEDDKRAQLYQLIAEKWNKFKYVMLLARSQCYFNKICLLTVCIRTECLLCKS